MPKGRMTMAPSSPLSMSENTGYPRGGLKASPVFSDIDRGEAIFCLPMAVSSTRSPKELDHPTLSYPVPRRDLLCY